MARNGAPTGSNTKPLDTVRHKQLQALVRSLDDTGDCDEGVPERVLMDADFDGRRYLLIRGPAIKPNAPVLSPRETEIVRLVAVGHPNKVIAAVLEISCWTVGTHVRRVFAKLGVTSRAAMVARLVEFGGLTEATLARMSDRPDDPRLRRPANVHSSTPEHENIPRLIRNRRLPGVAQQGDRAKKSMTKG